MIKLTDQRVQELVQEAHVAFCENKYQSFELAFADMAQAEVLRLNGITDHSADAGKMVFEEQWKRACTIVDDQIDESPRATGCPDTMDDTGHFAEVDMPAFLRKQAG